jgi:hypothetical protein
MLQTSIHAYHREAKEAEKMALQMEKENKIQNKEIKEIEKEMETK